MIQDLLQETLRSLSANKARSLLTMVGIIIGIASVITMLAIGQGAKNSIQKSIEGLGSNLITIMPGVVQPGRGIISSGRGSAQSLDNNDVKLLSAIPEIADISPEVSRRFQVVGSTGNNTNTTVTGARTSFATVRNIEMDRGVFLSESNVQSVGRQAVLGANVATDIFGETDALGKTIRINKITFTVVGIMKAKGGLGFSGPDDMVIIPLTTMQQVVAGTDNLSFISVSVADKEKITAVNQEITETLLQAHRVTEADFSLISQKDILGTLSTVINTFTLFLASIAGISLLVGGIGIMNMMLTTVTERTREIGLKKSVGIRRANIQIQFLTEAIILTFLGGVIGIFLGWLVSFIVSQFTAITTAVSLGSIILAFGVSAAVGIIFGYYPARRAARLNPIVALRHE